MVVAGDEVEEGWGGQRGSTPRVNKKVKWAWSGLGLWIIWTGPRLIFGFGIGFCYLFI